MDKVLLKVADLVSGIDKRFIIGISGHGASGKATFAHNLLALLGNNNVNYTIRIPILSGLPFGSTL